MAKKPAEALVYKDIDGKIVVEEFGSSGRADSRERELKAHGIKAVKTIKKIDWIESESEYKKILEKTKSAVKAMRDKKTALDRAVRTIDTFTMDSWMDDAIDDLRLSLDKPYTDFKYKRLTAKEFEKECNRMIGKFEKECNAQIDNIKKRMKSEIAIQKKDIQKEMR